MPWGFLAPLAELECFPVHHTDPWHVTTQMMSLESWVLRVFMNQTWECGSRECVGSGEWWGVRFSVSLGGKKCFCEPALPFSSEFVFRHVPSVLWLFLTILPSNLSLTSFHIYTVLPLSHSPQIPLLKCWLWRNYSSIEHLCVTNKRDKWCMHIVEVSVYMSLKTKF